MKTVAVFFGGNSSEREISVITGVYAVNLLRGASYRVLPVYLSEKNDMFLFEGAREIADFISSGDLDQKKFLPVRLVRNGLCFDKKPKKIIAIDCALNCCHGGLGEGGALSALLEWNEILSASPGISESAVFLDKALTKIALKGLGVPVVPFVVLREREWREDAAKRLEEELGYPMIVKPSKLGSSVGITVAKNAEELTCALALCFRLDSAAVIEKYLPGKRDLNCAAFRLDGEIVLSPVEEVFSSELILSFGEKYEGRGERTSQTPAQIPQEISERITDLLRRVYGGFEMRGIVRADFLLCGMELYFNELNTVPGTLATYLFGESLLNARKLLAGLVEDALNNRAARKEIVESGILIRGRFGGKTGKRR